MEAAEDEHQCCRRNWIGNRRRPVTDARNMLKLATGILVTLNVVTHLALAAMSLPDGIENILGFVPKSTFQCERDGYFGDIDNDCRIFHLCQKQVHTNGRTEWRHWTYACGNQTMFNQLTLTCAFVDEAIPCKHASQFQYLNEVIHKPKEPFLTDADVTSGISYYSNRVMSDGARARAFEDSNLMAQIGGQATLASIMAANSNNFATNSAPDAFSDRDDISSHSLNSVELMSTDTFRQSAASTGQQRQQRQPQQAQPLLQRQQQQVPFASSAPLPIPQTNPNAELIINHQHHFQHQHQRQRQQHQHHQPQPQQRQQQQQPQQQQSQLQAIQSNFARAAQFAPVPIINSPPQQSVAESASNIFANQQQQPPQQQPPQQQQQPQQQLPQQQGSGQPLAAANPTSSNGQYSFEFSISTNHQQGPASPGSSVVVSNQRFAPAAQQNQQQQPSTASLRILPPSSEQSLAPTTSTLGATTTQTQTGSSPVPTFGSVPVTTPVTLVPQTLAPVAITTTSSNSFLLNTQPATETFTAPQAITASHSVRSQAPPSPPTTTAALPAPTATTTTTAAAATTTTTATTSATTTTGASEQQARRRDQSLRSNQLRQHRNLHNDLVFDRVHSSFQSTRLNSQQQLDNRPKRSESALVMRRQLAAASPRSLQSSAPKLGTSDANKASAAFVDDFWRRSFDMSFLTPRFEQLLTRRRV